MSLLRHTHRAGIAGSSVSPAALIVTAAFLAVRVFRPAGVGAGPIPALSGATAASRRAESAP
jgi:hypothetical protein